MTLLYVRSVDARKLPLVILASRDARYWSAARRKVIPVPIYRLIPWPGLDSNQRATDYESTGPRRIPMFTGVSDALSSPREGRETVVRGAFWGAKGDGSPWDVGLVPAAWVGVARLRIETCTCCA